MPKPRKIKRHLIVLCEGQTEKNYFEELRKNLSDIRISYKFVDVRGGGYKNFLKKTKEQTLIGSLAIVIIMDLDKIVDPGENAAFKELFAYCRRMNNQNQVPHVLIGTYKDFEWYLCMHNKNYTNSSTSAFIKSNYPYNSPDELKRDGKVYERFNSGSSSYLTAHDRLSDKDSFITNNLKATIDSTGMNIHVSVNKMQLNDLLMTVSNSNMNDLLKLMGID